MEINVEKLSELSRIHLTDEDFLSLNKNIASIFEYSGKVQEVSGVIDASLDKYVGEISNVLREDVVERQYDFEVEDIINSFPKSKERHLSVKKIL